MSTARASRWNRDRRSRAGAVPRRRPPAVGELCAGVRAAREKVEAARADVLDHDLAVPSPDAAGEQSPGADAEGCGFALDPDADGSPPLRV